MTPKTLRLGAALALALILLAGCDPNPGGPRAPDHSPPKGPTEGPTERQPITKNPREIVNPD